MRAFACGLTFAALAGGIGGCCGCHSKPAATQPAVAATAASGSQPFVMPSGSAKVLQITAPADVKGAVADGSLKFAGPGYDVEFWLVRGSSSVDDAVGKVAGQIVDEFKDFKPNNTSDLTIAGAPAKRLVGTGHEADDGDPGSADLIVFKVGDHVFVGCDHGETLSGAGQLALLALTQTAQLP